MESGEENGERCPLFKYVSVAMSTIGLSFQNGDKTPA